MQLVGRSSSHFTRVVAIVAHELGVPYELVPIPTLRSLDADTYGDNPALKLPTLRLDDGALVFGTENICRRLVALAPPGPRVVLPLSLVLGASFLVACDALARVILQHRELPVGVVTAALGAPALVVLIARQRA